MAAGAWGVKIACFLKGSSETERDSTMYWEKVSAGPFVLLAGDPKNGFPTGRKFAAGIVTGCPFRPQNPPILLDKVDGLCSRLKGGTQVSGARGQGSGTWDSGFGIRVRAMKGNRTGELIIWEMPRRWKRWAAMLSKGRSRWADDVEPLSCTVKEESRRCRPQLEN